MKKYTTIVQKDITDFFTFDCTKAEHLQKFSTTETTSQKHFLNPFYACRCRRGYSLHSDPFFAWKLQEVPSDYSRKDLAQAFRLSTKGAY